MRVFGHYINNNNTYRRRLRLLGSGQQHAAGARSEYANPGYSWAVGSTYIFGPTMTNEFNIGVQPQQHPDRIHHGCYHARRQPASTCRCSIPTPCRSDYLPYVTFGGSASATQPAINQATTARPFINYNTTFDITDCVSKVWDRHTIKFGLYMQRSRQEPDLLRRVRRELQLRRQLDNPYDTDFGFANAALGVYNTFSQAANFINGQYRYWNLEFYAQDTWKITPPPDAGLRHARGLGTSRSTTHPCRPPRSCPRPGTQSAGPRLYVPQMVNGVRSAVDPGPDNGAPAADIGYHRAEHRKRRQRYRAGRSQRLHQVPAEHRPASHMGPRLGIAWDPTGRPEVS